MFEYLKASKVGKDGIEHVCASVNPFRIDDSGLGYGKTIVLINNYVKNTYEIQEHKLIHGCGQFVCSIEKGKEETKTVNEFRKWLLDNEYSDEDFINAMKDNYKDAYEKYYKH